MRLKKSERGSIGVMAQALDGLPRRTLRFINTYRIIKGSLSGPEQDHLEAVGSKALTALLAIAIELEDAFPAYLEGEDLMPSANDRAPQAPGQGAALGQDQRDRVGRCLELAEHPSKEELQRYAPQVSRFSFHRGFAVV